MSLIVRFSIAARIDVDEYAAYIAQDSPDAARRFIAATRATTDELARFPRMGPELVFPRLRWRGIRKLAIDGFRNHLLIYRPEKRTLDILCVTHAARDLPRALRRMLRDPDSKHF